MTNQPYKKAGGPYRSRQGVLFGVCAGIAEHTGMNVTTVRILTVIIAIFTGGWMVPGLYFLAALLMKPEPVLPFKQEGEEEFYNSYATSRHAAIQRLKRIHDKLSRRIERMESAVTDREYDWHQRLKKNGE
ncbi:MAG: PspC domain-containing protein [Planctomycetes bacterium]|nr:PspC domain-containing protein [Planctomycetota bacterium]